MNAESGPQDHTESGPQDRTKGLRTERATYEELSFAATAPTPPVQRAREAKSQQQQQGVTEKQINLLEVCADRLHTEAVPDVWRLAPAGTVQQQIRRAMQARNRDGNRHKHAVNAEILIRCGVENGLLFREVVQRCGCGAVRVTCIDRAGGDAGAPWVLCGETARAYVAGADPEWIWSVPAELVTGDGDARLIGWREPLTWSDVQIEIERDAGWEGDPKLKMRRP